MSSNTFTFTMDRIDSNLLFRLLHGKFTFLHLWYENFSVLVTSLKCNYTLGHFLVRSNIYGKTEMNSYVSFENITQVPLDNPTNIVKFWFHIQHESANLIHCRCFRNYLAIGWKKLNYYFLSKKKTTLTLQWIQRLVLSWMGTAASGVVGYLLF